MVLKIITFLFVLGTISGCGSSEISEKKSTILELPDGEELFVQNCASCHGCDGTLGMSGAHDLSKSTMTFNEMKFVIEKGKGSMPRFKEMLSDEGELDAVVEHTLTLKK